MSIDNISLLLRSNSSDEECVSLKENLVVGLTVLPALIAIINVIFLTAVLLHWERLKQSNVYRYVASTFTANIFISGLGFYHFLNYYFGFESHTPNLWWAFRKGMQLALSLVLCGNIGLMIYGLHDSTYIVRRHVQNTSQIENLNAKYRRRKANGLILFVWSLPTAYGLLAMTPWNCTTGQCTCTLSYESGKSICIGELCSNVYNPMAKSYLLVVVMLWALECIGLLAIFLKSILALKANHKNKLESFTFFLAFKESMPKYAVVYILFVLFVACTAPDMILFGIDFFVSDALFNHMLVNVLLPLPLVYCLFCPFLLFQKLSGVRAAMQLLCNFPCTKKTSRRRSNRTDRLISINVTSSNV